MLKIVVFLALALSVSASPLPDRGRIVNGTDAQVGEIPYIVSLRLGQFKSHVCGGSILDSTHILTAAHCVVPYPPEYFSIQYGVTRLSEDDLNAIGVEAIYTHEEYAPGNNYANDISVLKLKSPIPLSENVQVVTLPKQNEAPPAGKTTVLAGWGLSHTGGSVMRSLQRVDILVYSDEDCKNAHGSNVNVKYHLCSGVPEGGKGQCSGDSGGPNVCDGVQVGIVSWSIKPCAVKDYPGVFARVSNYIDWINEKRKL